MTKTQFLPIFLGRRYVRSQYFWVQNFQGIHVFGLEFYPPYAHPRIQIYEVPSWGQKNFSAKVVPRFEGPFEVIDFGHYKMNLKLKDCRTGKTRVCHCEQIKVL